MRIPRQRDLGGARLTIRDRVTHEHGRNLRRDPGRVQPRRRGVPTLVEPYRLEVLRLCLLYTSDAADE